MSDIVLIIIFSHLCPRHMGQMEEVFMGFINSAYTGIMWAALCPAAFVSLMSQVANRDGWTETSYRLEPDCPNGSEKLVLIVPIVRIKAADIVGEVDFTYVCNHIL